MQNGFVESFNGRLRDECLNEISVPQLPTRPGHYRKLEDRLHSGTTAYEPRRSHSPWICKPVQQRSHREQS